MEFRPAFCLQRVLPQITQRRLVQARLGSTTKNVERVGIGIEGQRCVIPWIRGIRAIIFGLRPRASLGSRLKEPQLVVVLEGPRGVVQLTPTEYSRELGVCDRVNNTGRRVAPAARGRKLGKLAPLGFAPGVGAERRVIPTVGELEHPAVRQAGLVLLPPADDNQALGVVKGDDGHATAAVGRGRVFCDLDLGPGNARVRVILLLERLRDWQCPNVLQEVTLAIIVASEYPKVAAEHVPIALPPWRWRRALVLRVEVPVGVRKWSVGVCWRVEIKACGPDVSEQRRTVGFLCLVVALTPPNKNLLL
mmetsp:Transcript_28248/g.63070  ORF Transcript_28248/g.63070 Transcript_28248/m.63070 type:complete len:306 (+) Transcript_28248:660-1577(+)